MLSANEIRRQFIDFFVEEHDHTFVPSSSVVPADDPTLLFTNAGMNQFKDVFLGTGTRNYRRAVDTQKCIRAGGKHNDLDDVGKDTYHHTFFEMLGNWSFGDYFKKEAIAWAWELLTEVWGLDKERLHATVFAGDAAEGLQADDEALELWRSQTDIHPSHIHRGSKKDNFWEMGETGPCGPCSEIHIDRGIEAAGYCAHPGQHCGVNVDGCARFIELGNLVFIQYDRDAGGKLTPLPMKHGDTGTGLERVASVMQSFETGKLLGNYDIDIFKTIISSIEKSVGSFGNGRPYGQDPESDISYRAIADHVRAI